MALYAEYEDDSGEYLSDAYWRIDQVLVERKTFSSGPECVFHIWAYRDKTKAQNRKIDPISGSLHSITRDNIIAAGVDFTEQELEDAIQDTGDGAIKIAYQKIKQMPAWSDSSDA